MWVLRPAEGSRDIPFGKWESENCGGGAVRVISEPVSLPEGRQMRELSMERSEGYEIKRAVSRIVIGRKLASGSDRESQWIQYLGEVECMM